MRKLSEIKGEDALDVLADVLDPFAEIAQDEKFVNIVRSGSSKIKIIEYLLRNHKKEVINILAILDGKSLDDFKPSVIQIPIMLLSLLNDPDLVMLFTSAETVTSSGSAMENTGETEEA